MFFLATPDAPCCNEVDILAAAMWAGDSVRPDNGNQEGKADIWIREIPKGFKKSLRKGLFVFHDSEILAQKAA